jgi:Domain of unknown function DUF29
MATRAGAARERLHEEDFYAWTGSRRRSCAPSASARSTWTVWSRPMEETGDVQREAALGNARVVLEHLLKLAHSPATDPRNGGRATVREHRARLELGLTPQLRQALQDELARVYAIARRNAEGALRDHGEQAAADALPATCPYTLDQITADWWP